MSVIHWRSFGFETERFESDHRLLPSSVRAIRSIEELHCIAPQWNRLALRRAGPVLDSDWASACADAFGLGKQLAIVVSGHRDLAAVAPLALRPGSAKCLEFLGSEQLREPMDFVYDTPPSIRPVAAALASGRWSLLLRRVPANSPTIDTLKREYRRKGLVLCRPSYPVSGIALDPSWSNPESHLNPGRRSDLRRLRRIAAGWGKVTSEFLVPEPAELAPLLEEAFEVEASGWKGKRGTALNSDPARRRFYARYAALACRRRLLRLSFLRIDGRAAAMQIAIESCGGYWLLKIGYREEYARCSPGNLLISESIAYAARRGLHSYHFLGTDEPWLRMWSPHRYPLVSVGVYAISFGGLNCLARDAWLVLRGKIRQRAARC